MRSYNKWFSKPELTTTCDKWLPVPCRYLSGVRAMVNHLSMYVRHGNLFLLGDLRGCLHNVKRRHLFCSVPCTYLAGVDVISRPGLPLFLRHKSNLLFRLTSRPTTAVWPRSRYKINMHVHLLPRNRDNLP
jgi:hypothetical protein